MRKTILTGILITFLSVGCDQQTPNQKIQEHPSQQTPTVNRNIEFIGPAAGDHYLPGLQYVIEWDKAAGVSGAIYLTGIDNSISGFISGYTAPDQRQFTWDTKSIAPTRNISPEVVVKPGKYKVTLLFDDNTVPAVTSGEFSILSEDQLPVVILTPSEGSQLERGKTYDITWKTNVKGINVVSLYLVIEDEHCHVGSPNSLSCQPTVIAKDILNKNIYKWKIPSDIRPSPNHGYRIYLKDGKGIIQDTPFSGFFQIKTTQ